MIDYKNILRVSSKVFKIYLGFNIPLRVTQYVTYRCNLNCGFCARSSIICEELTTAQIIQCIKEFKALGTEFWGFNGGEPLLREDIGVFINLCKKLGLKTSLFTNGTLIPERIHDIKDLDLILISIDGPEQVHDKIRKKDSFKKTLKGLDTIRCKKKNVIIATVLNNENIPYLNDIIKIAEYYNCFCEFQPIFIHNSDRDKKALKYIPEQMEEAAEYLIKEKETGRPIANSYAYLYMLKNYPYPKKQICWAKSFFCVITPDGVVNPCCIMLPYKNLSKPDFENGWKSAYFALPQKKKCDGCFAFCYFEYNLLLNNPLSLFRIAKNMLNKTWITK